MVGWCNLNGCRQIEDDTVIEVWTGPSPRLLDRFTNLNGELGLCLTERFRTILKSELGAVLRCAFVGELPYNLCVFDSESKRFLLRVFEDDGPEEGRGGVIHMKYCLFTTGDGVYRSFDEIFPSRRQNLHDIILVRLFR